MSRFAVLTVYSLAILLGVSCEPALGENDGPYVGTSSGISVPNVDNEDLNAKLQSLGFASASTSTGQRGTSFKVFIRYSTASTTSPRSARATGTLTSAFALRLRRTP